MGLTLIEIMVALLIGTVLLVGLVQIFGASRTAYQLSEGLARVQENSRFAVDYLQRDIRMAGHFGCVNDQAHTQSNPSSLATTFAAVPTTTPPNEALRFNFSVQGFEANGTSPGNTITLTAPPAGWSAPFAGSAIDTATAGNRINGSDILVLRFLMPEGVPVTAIGGTPSAPSFTFDNSRWAVLRSGVDAPGLFGIADCLNATVFQASAASAGTVSMTGAAPLNVSAFTQVYAPGQANLYRAESVIYYVGNNANGGTSLYRVRYAATPAGAGAYGAPEELVEGIENMQLLYGFDRQTDPAVPPTGFIDNQSVALAGALSTPERWRRAGAIQVGLLAVSPNAASAPAPVGDDRPMSQGVFINAPADQRLRFVYQTTIALRNRLYGN
jgi:type IV pilus assembly protein PilW